MDPEELRRALMGLKRCVVFHDIRPEQLDAIRAAASPQPPAEVRWGEGARIARDFPALTPYVLETAEEVSRREAAHRLTQEYILASLIYRGEPPRGPINL